ncbi:hypothetical protein F4775DRAFT_575573 [Biscogniauxia sp. FL1348]|nr:hypothetical protein F4775DRAFT_575573 [Biscogniauxia sp. FL1348]
MALRYTIDALIILRDSPLCTKPNNLPPAEEWMGPPPETFRNNQGNKSGNDRNRNNTDSSLLEQTNRRTGADRHASRNSANPEEIILGPPRTTFSSATLSSRTKAFDNEKAFKDTDARDRFNFRARNGDVENTTERFRDRERDGRSTFRRRADGDQDSDGWTPVKPRKSFGHEGAERFHGRMGERPDRFGGERKPRDQEDRETNTERPRRNFGEFAREKEGEDSDKPRRNGLNRTRPDQPWNRESTDAPAPRERFDRSKSWRERADDNADGHHEKPRERTYERRWDRDHRQERDPEWLDEPLEGQSQAHTQEDFKKFMDTMKGKSASKAEQPPPPMLLAESPSPQERAEADKPKVKSAPAIELGQDKFFAAFAPKPTLEASGGIVDGVKESAAHTPKAKTGSRFQNFFSSQEESRRQTEPPTPAAAPPVHEMNPLLAMAGSQPDTAEKVAFQALLQKLQKQTLQASTPPSAGFSEPPPSHEFGPKSVMTSPGPYQPYGQQERREEPMPRGPPPQPQELHAPRPQPNPQFAALRPEQQMLHDLIGQRHPSQTQGPGRADQPSIRSNNSNAEFLMTLMQGPRPAPEPQRNEPLVMRMPQPSRPTQIPPTPDREPDFARERGAPQHQGGRPAGLPGFFDEAVIHHREQESRPQQPTQILQRQGPPGLDPMHTNAWMQTGAQLPPPGRPMIPPPGLAGNPRNGPIPGAFPPNFPMGGFPPDAMAGPPRNMAPPPGFFGGPPPPGFMPPPGMGGFQGPEALAFGFDGRGMPPPGSGGPFRRN